MATRQFGRRGVNLLARETLEYQLHQDREAGEFSLLARIVLSDAPAGEVEMYSKAQSAVDDLINHGRDREGEIPAHISGKFGEGDIRWLLACLSYYTVGSRLTSIPRQRLYHSVAARF